MKILFLLFGVFLLYWEPCRSFSMLNSGRSFRGQTPQRSYVTEVPALSVTSRLGTWSLALRSFARRVLAFLSMFAWWNSSTSKAHRAAVPAPKVMLETPVALAPPKVIKTLPETPKVTILETSVVETADSMQSTVEDAEPHVPGMSETNLMVRLDSEPGVAVTQMAEEKMKRSDQEVLEDLCGEGWSVRPIDASKGSFEITLPAVRYPMPMGIVSIPSPLFHAQVRKSSKVSGSYHERLVADIVLQNGQKILCVELGFPFSSQFTISAAGWARCRVGREPGSVRCQALVEMGLHVPKVPGLTSILQFFVKSYANKSAKDCAVSLSKTGYKVP